MWPTKSRLNTNGLTVYKTPAEIRLVREPPASREMPRNAVGKNNRKSNHVETEPSAQFSSPVNNEPTTPDVNPPKRPSVLIETIGVVGPIDQSSRKSRPPPKNGIHTARPIKSPSANISQSARLRN